MDGKRTANFSEIEKNILIRIIEKYKNIIENKESNNVYLKKKNDTWLHICDEFNAESSHIRSVKQIKNLYFNLKRKLKKEVAEEHKNDYIRAKKLATLDKKELHKTGGGTFQPQLDEVGAQLLAVFSDQIEPLPNPFDDANAYFSRDKNDVFLTEEIEIEPITVSTISLPEVFTATSPSTVPIPVPEPNPKPQTKKTPIRRKKYKQTKINYKELYFKKKYEIACFELKSKKILHNLEYKMKKKQLENLN